MAGLRIGQDGQALAQAAIVIGWRPAAAARRGRAGLRPGDWIEATMRRLELPSLVDVAKRPDTTLRLSRLLGL